MVIGVPKETHRHEHRVGLSPFAVSRLTRMGHTVFVEREAGEAAHFADQHFESAGAEIVYSSEEVYQRADLICQVGVLSGAAVELLKPQSIVCAFHHLAISSEEVVQRLMDLETTAIGYEVICDRLGRRPVLIAFSEMAGRLAVDIASSHLQTESGGRGILFANVPGVPPPTMVILGGGTLGKAAAHDALAKGAHVVVMDDSMEALRALSQQTGGKVVTAITTQARLQHYTAIADVLIGAILIPGERAPYVVTEEMGKAMKPGSVIIDASIDQGGCVETSRPTSLDQPTFKAHDVVHYCVPNMTANIPRTASRALSNTALPFVTELANCGLESALRDDPGLAEGVYLFRGKKVHYSVAGVDEPDLSLAKLLEEARS
jgi:alanine dehydrogenase